MTTVRSWAYDAVAFGQFLFGAKPPTETADETKRVDLEVVPRAYKPRGNPRGRTRRLTLRAFVRICHLVEQGWAITKACESESVTYSLFRLRCSENPRLERRIKEATATRFQRRHEEAVESVMRAGEKDWTAHAWWLERNLPQLYSLKSVDRSEAEKGLNPTTPVMRVLILPDADFEQILGNPNYAILPNGSLERVEGSLRIRIVRGSTSPNSLTKGTKSYGHEIDSSK